MTQELIFNLISKDRRNIVKLGKAIRTDFEGLLGYYTIFEKLSIEKALLKVSEDIAESYQDNMDVWENIKEGLE